MSFSDKLDQTLHNNLLKLVTQKTGLVVRSQDQDLFDQKISFRMRSTKIATVDDYYRFLLQQSSESEQEWSKLISLLTNNESLFFRDKEQFKLIRETILPDLIERKQEQKTLRICSAGCSTGQEPYSLAITLKELIPNIYSWTILIAGIDIDKLALKEAKKAVYTDWSFRGTKLGVRQQYFQKINNQYHLNPDIKRMVQFQQVNLITETLPQVNGILSDMDLIICRNVFIYFEKHNIQSVVEKIYDMLQPEGYFMAGHTELTEQNLNKFNTLVFPQSLIYQKPKDNILNKILKPIIFPQNNQKSSRQDTHKNLDKDVHPIIKNTTKENKVEKLLKTKSLKKPPQKNIEKKEITPSTPKPIQKTLKDSLILKNTYESSPPKKDALKEAELLFQQEKYQQAIAKIEEILSNNDQNFKAYNLLAQMYANISQYSQAKEHCQKALEIDSLNTSPYQILAKIAEEENDLEEAKRILKQIIYLEPSSVSAYLDLSYIYQQEGDLSRMNKMKDIALDILKELPPDTVIKDKGNITASLLLQKLK